MGVAGLWSTWRAPNGELIESFTMLTINADGHILMRQFHKPADEKRMIVILPAERYDDWLRAKPEQSLRFLQPYPADKLCVAAE
jgi:putative SOS response-associated peptidase YedK